jgi:hypothetical protein
MMMMMTMKIQIVMCLSKVIGLKNLINHKISVQIRISHYYNNNFKKKIKIRTASLKQ